MQLEVSSREVTASARLGLTDARGVEGRFGILGDVEQVGALEVRGEAGFVGLDGVRVDLDLDRASFGLVVDEVDGAFEGAEEALVRSA